MEKCWGLVAGQPDGNLVGILQSLFQVPVIDERILGQCCGSGSGSAWIRNFCLDPDLDPEL